jgi:ribosomal protein S12 methylthiotransferase accessory factor
LAVIGITRLADVTGLDDVGIPVYVAVRPASATLAVSAGKGVTHLLARVSAAMEMIEFAHAEQVAPACVRGAARDVHDGSYDVRELQLVQGSMVSETVVLDWLEARTILTGRHTLVPRDYVQVSNAFRREWTPPLFDTSTNGLASGNTVAEATLHGLYELIERDCLAELAEVPRAVQPRVDPDDLVDDDCRCLVERLTAAANWFEIIDATNQIGVPCYVANIWSPSFPVLMSGAGCHLDPAVAMNRAITEAAQSRLAIISGTRESVPEQVYLLSHVHYDRPAPPGEDVPRAPVRRNDESGASIDDDLVAVASRVEARLGHEPFVVDLSRPEIGVAVTKTIMPGLRFDPAHGTTQKVRQG